MATYGRIKDNQLGKGANFIIYVCLLPHLFSENNPSEQRSRNDKYDININITVSLLDNRFSISN
jgi:hypothetical protein